MPFVIYQCDTCRRETELQLDGSRPDPVRCNITLKCRGKLQRAGVRQAKKQMFTPLASGLQDFVPRGDPTFLPEASTDGDAPVPLTTAGGEGMLAMAAPRRVVADGVTTFSIIGEDGQEVVLETYSGITVTPSTVKMSLKFYELTPELQRFKKYTYILKGVVQAVRGTDHSAIGRNLRFSSEQQVRVLLNGVELTEQQFDRTTDDLVVLTPAAPDSNHVIDVVVYDDLSTLLRDDQVKSVEFNPLLPTSDGHIALRELNCWGEALEVQIGGVARVVMFAPDLSEFFPDRAYEVKELTVTSSLVQEPITVLGSEAAILLGRDPYSQFDRDPNRYLSVNSLLNRGAVLDNRIDIDTGGAVLEVPAGELTEVYNGIVVTERLAQAQTFSAAGALGGTTTSVGSKPLPKKYILGPS